MSKISIEGNASGTGTLTIAAPNTNSNFTLDIPSASGVIDRLNRAGNVLQVVSATYSTSTAITTTTFTDSGLTASITPTNASSKIFILANGVSYYSRGLSGIDMGIGFRIVRDSTSIYSHNLGFYDFISGASSSNGFYRQMSMTYLDSPATTSATAYKVQIRCHNASNTPDARLQVANFPSTITLMEIAA